MSTGIHINPSHSLILRVPEPLPLDQWKKLTYKGLLDEVSNFAKALISIGFEQHDAVGIFGFNSVEWIVSTYGAIFAGGIVAGMYPTDNAEQVRSIGVSVCGCDE